MLWQLAPHLHVWYRQWTQQSSVTCHIHQTSQSYKHSQLHCLTVHKCMISTTIAIYSVSRKILPNPWFSEFFPNSIEFLIKILHAYYKFTFTLDYKILFSYSQLWQSYVAPSEFLHFTTHLSQVLLTNDEQRIKTYFFFAFYETANS